MATVIKNPDNTFTVTLTPKEGRSLVRAAAEAPAVTAAQKLAEVLTTHILGWTTDFSNADGPTRLRKFDLLGINKQDQVDALLNGA